MIVGKKFNTVKFSCLVNRCPNKIKNVFGCCCSITCLDAKKTFHVSFLFSSSATRKSPTFFNGKSFISLSIILQQIHLLFICKSFFFLCLCYHYDISILCIVLLSKTFKDDCLSKLLVINGGAGPVRLLFLGTSLTISLQRLVRQYRVCSISQSN